MPVVEVRVTDLYRDSRACPGGQSSEELERVYALAGADRASPALVGMLLVTKNERRFRSMAEIVGDRRRRGVFLIGLVMGEAPSSPIAGVLSAQATGLRGSKVDAEMAGTYARADIGLWVPESTNRPTVARTILEQAFLGDEPMIPVAGDTLLRADKETAAQFPWLPAGHITRSVLPEAIDIMGMQVSPDEQAAYAELLTV